MLPVRVCFDDLTSRIQLDDKRQPCLNLSLTLSLPIAAIVNALSRFQREHEGDASMSAAATPYQPPAAVGGVTAATGKEKAAVGGVTAATGKVEAKPPSREASASGISVTGNEAASVIASTLRGAAAAQPPREAREPISALFKDDGYGPAPGLEKPIPRSKDESFTWDTPISKLHDVYEESRKRTTWVCKSGKDIWVLDDDDEACLLNFEPVPLSAPSFGRGDKKEEVDEAPMFL